MVSEHSRNAAGRDWRANRERRVIDDSAEGERGEGLKPQKIVKVYGDWS
jgi:hypothetical protein